MLHTPLTNNLLNKLTLTNNHTGKDKPDMVVYTP
jgi:hypothetical protein